MKIEFHHSGDFKRLEKFLALMKKGDLYKGLDALAQKGVNALAANTPKDSGLTADSWGYQIKISMSSVVISWTNRNTNGDVNVAVILQMGHGTGTGGYVQGRDYINPAMKGVFDEIADGVWKVVTSA